MPDATPRPASELPVLEPGVGYRLTGRGFGDRIGAVTLGFGDLNLRCNILTWSRDEVTFTAPALNMNGPARADLIVRTADGRDAFRRTVAVEGVRLDTTTPLTVPPPVPPRTPPAVPLPVEPRFDPNFEGELLPVE